MRTIRDTVRSVDGVADERREEEARLKLMCLPPVDREKETFHRMGNDPKNTEPQNVQFVTKGMSLRMSFQILEVEIKTLRK